MFLNKLKSLDFHPTPGCPEDCLSNTEYFIVILVKIHDTDILQTANTLQSLRKSHDILKSKLQIEINKYWFFLDQLFSQYTYPI